MKLLVMYILIYENMLSVRNLQSHKYDYTFAIILKIFSYSRFF